MNNNLYRLQTLQYIFPKMIFRHFNNLYYIRTNVKYSEDKANQIKNKNIALFTENGIINIIYTNKVNYNNMYQILTLLSQKP